MKMAFAEPEISERFDVNDIRKIRDYNAVRHSEMSAKEIVEEIREHTAEVVKSLGVKSLSGV